MLGRVGRMRRIAVEGFVAVLLLAVRTILS